MSLPTMPGPAAALLDLQAAASRITVRPQGMSGVKMTAGTDRKGQEDGSGVFDDPEAFFGALHTSFTKAAQSAVAENDRLGIPTHGAVNGKLTVKRPRKAKALDSV